ncbi:unnamed protein product [Candidula unifasciata]|uniref:Outer dense fiber protein 3 n=1 Tax=Candidula unifasciata TaxID=100452 RepID=A0A8S4A345_9EUPU|nr:unnamed protein product [Candidula unifasciata]
MVYEYTKPRGPIAQLYTSPGPAYMLPTLLGERAHDPRSVHYKNPAYSFGVRHGYYKSTPGPGPCHYPNPKIQRDGLEGTPSYSLYSRQKDIRSLNTPGPGAHCVDNAVTATRPHYPAYTFGNRHQRGRADKIPAPNCYSLPNPAVQSTKPQAPWYSLKGHLKYDKIQEKAKRTPGPGTATDPSVYKNRAPYYSLTSRNLMPGDNVQKPGPAAHIADKSCVQHCNPAYSFGIRHSSFMTPLIVDLPSIECGACE